MSAAFFAKRLTSLMVKGDDKDGCSLEKSLFPTIKKITSRQTQLMCRSWKKTEPDKATLQVKEKPILILILILKLPLILAHPKLFS